MEKKKELTNLNDAIEELIIFDESDMVPFQYGEVFTHLTVDDANKELERAKKVLENEIKTLENKVNTTKKLLAELKTQLYAKFGNKINLEETEED